MWSTVSTKLFCNHISCNFFLTKIVVFIHVNHMTIFPLLTIRNDHNYLLIMGVYSTCSMYYIITNMTFGNFMPGLKCNAM